MSKTAMKTNIDTIRDSDNIYLILLFYIYICIYIHNNYYIIKQTKQNKNISHIRFHI